MAQAQTHILLPPSPHALFLTLGMQAHADALPALKALRQFWKPDHGVVGLGAPLVAALGAPVPGLKAFGTVHGPGVVYPATQGALWLALYDADPGQLLLRARTALAALGDAFVVEDQTAAYTFEGGKDLSGFVDGTANPDGDAATQTAVCSGGAGMAGSSFVHVQRWVHQLAVLERMDAAEKDDVIGRRLADNEEMEDAPASAHVKRTEQESVGFLLRRSMPWGDVASHGLVFVAYSTGCEAFLRHLNRMVGAADGVVDALNRFSRPVTGGWYWCPPLHNGGLDLRAVTPAA